MIGPFPYDAIGGEKIIVTSDDHSNPIFFKSEKHRGQIKSLLLSHVSVPTGVPDPCTIKLKFTKQQQKRGFIKNKTYCLNFNGSKKGSTQLYNRG